MSVIAKAFDDPSFKAKVRDELPSLFREARQEALEFNNIFIVGNFRKQKLMKLLIEYFGEDVIDFSSTRDLPGIDAKVDSSFISIKTIRENNLVKIIWGSDRVKMLERIENYVPNSNVLLVKINWEMEEKYQPSGLFWIPIKAQLRVFKRVGKNEYFKPPREGTNSRGVPMTNQVLKILLNDQDTRKIDINWRK